MNIIILTAIIFAIAVFMTMTGRGGGNFYVLSLVLAGMAMHQAAATAQFILIITALAGMIIFQKNKMIDWKLALILDPPTDIMAFLGGYISGQVHSTHLKIVFSFLLVIAGLLMLIPVKERVLPQTNKRGFLTRTFDGQTYTVNLWLAIPVTALTGLVSGAMGISGGSFKVPLMVLFCGVPMRIAVGTSSAMVAATALMGFAGHLATGHFEFTPALPLALAALAGGIAGSKFALKTKSKNLKKLFAFTTIAAALFMLANTFVK